MNETTELKDLQETVSKQADENKKISKALLATTAELEKYKELILRATENYKKKEEEIKKLNEEKDSLKSGILGGVQPTKTYTEEEFEKSVETLEKMLSNA